MEKEYSVDIDGETVVFEFKDSLIHSEGPSAGNIDAIITTRPPLPQNLLLDELHIKVPGSDEFLYIYGYGVVENSLKATFNSSALVDADKLPDMVQVYWGAHGEKFIGDMCCQQFSEEAESRITVDSDDDEQAETGPEEEQAVSDIESNSEHGEFNYQRFIYAGIIVILFIVFYFILV